MSFVIPSIYYLKTGSDLFTIIKEGFFCPSGHKIEREITSGRIYDYAQEKAREMGLKKTVHIYKDKMPVMAAFGNAFLSTKIGFTLSESLTPVLEGFSEQINLSEEQLKFFVSHELSHIKNNDLIIWRLIPVISSLVTYTLLKKINPFLGFFSALSVHTIAVRKISKWREHVADLTACKYSSKQIIEAGIRAFENIHFFYEKFHNFAPLKASLVKGFLYTSHPTPLKRIEYIRKNLLKKD